MPQRSSTRRKSTSSISFPKKKKRNESAVSKKAISSTSKREQTMEQSRLKKSKRERDMATVNLYDAQAMNSIDDKAFMKKSVKEQLLTIHREVRAIKLVTIKTRRVQHTGKKPTVEVFKVTALMNRRMTSFVCNFLFGNTKHGDARANLTVYPMELWRLIEHAIINDFLKSNDPIAIQFSKDSDAALLEGQKAFKKIRQRLYNQLNWWMKGRKGKEAAIKIASRLQMKLEKEYKISEDEYNRLEAYTRFETEFAAGIGVETDLIKIGADYGVMECANVINCVGDVLDSYMKFRKLQSWKVNCKQMIKAIEKFHTLMREEESNQQFLPDTSLEFPSSYVENEMTLSMSDWNSDSEDQPNFHATKTTTTEKVAGVYVLSDTDEEPEEIEKPQRKLASSNLDESQGREKKGKKRSRSIDSVEAWRRKKPKIDAKKSITPPFSPSSTPPFSPISTPTLSLSFPESLPPLEPLVSQDGNAK